VGRFREQPPSPFLQAHTGPDGARPRLERREFDRMILAINRVLDFAK
jgi:hypothetical protein